MNSKMNTKKTLLATMVGLFATAGGVGSALGQGDEAATAQGRIDEIIVTANKREQSLQDTAMSISALGGEEINDKSIISMADYLRFIPGVNQIDRGPGRNSIVIRGVSADPQTGALAMGPTVGIYLGDVPLTGYSETGGSSDIKLVDMQRVEVLRGPQGTLYGDSSLGGTVRYIPVPPTQGNLEGSFKLGYSNTADTGGNNTEMEALINVPLIEDELALRAVGYRFENDGYIDNLAASDPISAATAGLYGVSDLAVDESHVGSDKYVGGRTSVIWQPNDRFSLSMLYAKQELEQTGFPEIELALGDYKQTRLLLSDTVANGKLIGGQERLGDDIDITNIVLKYDLAWGIIVSSTSWVSEDSIEARDIGSFFGGVPAPQKNTTDTSAFIEEFRFTSNFESPFQMLVGLYYQDVVKDRNSLLIYGGDLSADPFGLGVLLGDTRTETEFKQTAVFGELSYDLTDNLKLTGGARYFDYEKDIVRSSVGAFGGTPVILTTAQKDPLFKANISYNLSDGMMFYAQWAEGFRLGTALNSDPAAICDLDNDGLIDGTNLPLSGRSLDSDELESFELGGKFNLFDNRLALNAAIYQNDWEGIPVRIATLCGRKAVNAGKAKTQGFEVEGQLKITEMFSLFFGGSYINAELEEDAPSLGTDGDRLPGSPEYNYNVGLKYKFFLTGRPSSIRTDYAYVGGFHNNLQQIGTQAGDYGILNLKASMKFKAIELEVFGKNLTNTDKLTWVGTVFSNADGRAFQSRPRTFGLKIGYEF